MNKYLKAVLLFLFYWAIVGTGLGIIISLFDSNLQVLGPLIGFISGVYFAVKTIRSNNKH